MSKIAFKKGTFEWTDELKSNVAFKGKADGKFNVHFMNKPTLFQRFLYWTGLKKRPKFDGSHINFFELDEVGSMGSNDVCERYEESKRYIAGVDPYDKDE